MVSSLTDVVFFFYVFFLNSASNWDKKLVRWRKIRICGRSKTAASLLNLFEIINASALIPPDPIKLLLEPGMLQGVMMAIEIQHHNFFKSLLKLVKRHSMYFDHFSLLIYSYSYRYFPFFLKIHRCTLPRAHQTLMIVFKLLYSCGPEYACILAGLRSGSESSHLRYL